MTETYTNLNGDVWEIYFAYGRVAEWCWKCTPLKGKIGRASTEGYRNKADCMADAERNGMECSLSYFSRLNRSFERSYWPELYS